MAPRKLGPPKDSPEDMAARREAGAGTVEPVVAAATVVVPDAPSGKMYGRKVDVGTRSATMVASAARININDRRAVATTARRRQGWQTEAWDTHDEVGEIGYATSFIANLMSKLRLYPACKPTHDSMPIPIDSDDSTFPAQYRQIAIDTLSRLKSGQGGQSAILRELSQNLEVAGEAYLHGHGETTELDSDEQDAAALPDWLTAQDPNYVPEMPSPETVEDWQIRSVDELTVHGDQFVLRRGPGSGTGTPIPDTDLVIRIWERHPRFSEMATCAMRRVLAEAEAVLLLSREIRATAKSRLSNGILLMPTELSFGAPDPTTDQSDGEAPADPFDNDLAEGMITPISEEGAASSVVPLVVRGTAEHLAAVRHILLERPLDAELGARIEQRILRIARGLNMPVEVTTGMMATTFANASQIKQSEYEDHIEPRAILVVDALTAAYYQWALVAAGVPEAIAETTFVWFDPDAIIVKPDQSESALTAFEAGAISSQALRKYLGFSEDDAPDPAELLQRLLLKGGRMDPTIEGQLLKLTGLAPAGLQVAAPASGVLGELDPVSAMPIPGVNPDAPPPVHILPGQAPSAPNTPPEPKATDTTPDQPPPAKKPSAAPVAAAGTPNQWAKLGPRLTAIDRDTRTRIIATLDSAMRSALDRAGNKIRAKTQREKGGQMSPARAAVDALPASEVAGRLGADAVHAAGMTDEELIAGAFTAAVDLAAQRMDIAYTAATKTIAAVTGPIPPGQLAQLDRDHAANVDQARTWLLENLHALAAARLYSPQGTIIPAGEHDGTVLIPAGLVRAAMAVAGGTRPTGGTIVAGAWVDAAGPVTDGNGGPVGGIGTGSSLMGAIASMGGSTEGWLWEWGGATRDPFQPHLDLDGKVVASLDGDEFKNTTGFPPLTSYFPGDHQGCQCDVSPVLVNTEGQTRTQTPDDLVTEAPDMGAVYVPSTASPSDYADQLGYERLTGEPTEEDVARALSELPAVRTEIQQAAAQIAESYNRSLDGYGIGRGSIVNPKPMRPQPDWYTSLSNEEKTRLRQSGWFAANEDSATAVGYDEVAEKMRAFGWSGDQTSGDPMTVWVEQTRIADGAQALANGRGISADRYGGLDLNHLIDTPYDIDRIFVPPAGSHTTGKDLVNGVKVAPTDAVKAERKAAADDQWKANRMEAARNIAEVRANEAADAAYQTLGTPIGGPAPWEMTEADYVAETARVEAAVRGISPIGEDAWGDVEYSPEDNVNLARITTLIPDGIDPEGTMSLDELYQTILQVARNAGLV